jgi:hypothetical protein
MLKSSYVLVAVLILGCSFSAEAAVLRNEDLGLKVGIPQGFRPNIDDPPGGDVLASYVRRDDRTNVAIALRVERLRGTIGRERLKEEEAQELLPRMGLPPGTTLDIVEARWQGFTIDVMRMRTPNGYLSLVAQVPLKPEAVQIIVSGSVRTEEACRDVLDEVLAGVEGKSNWLSGSERSSRLLTGLLRLAIVIAVIVIIVRLLRR